MNGKLTLIGLLGCAASSAAYAQQAPAPQASASQAAPKAAQPKPAARPAASEDNEVEAVTVIGGKAFGAVIGDIPPEETLNAADVRSFGVSSMEDLLAELSPQTTSGLGGDPVVLLNGHRISSFAEIRDVPTEAIQRVEILPEEVALKYGYTADQKVVNVVLRQRFRASTVEASIAAPTEGGQTTEQVDASRLRINHDGRMNVAAKIQHSDALLESDRDIVDTGANGSSDPPGARTLLPSTKQLTANAVYNRFIFGDISATLNVSGSAAETSALLGSATARLPQPGGDPILLTSQDPTPLGQDTRNLAGHLGFTLNRDTEAWRLSLTGNYDHAVSRTLTDRVDLAALQAQVAAADPAQDPLASIGALPLGSDRARSTSDTANVQMVTNGALAHLPGGDLSTTLKVGFEGTRFDATSQRAGLESDSDLSRDNFNAQISFDLPLASRRKGGLTMLGDFSTNLNLAVNQLSDFGTLTTIGYGLNWSPLTPISFIVSVTDQKNAPTIQQLGNPLVVTPDARVFDFVKGETVDVTRISGGNPDLKAEDRHVLKLGLTVKPPSVTGLSVTANYTRTRIDNPVSSFPAPTAAVEAAFPDRFTRDADGDLTRIDGRPVNFARRDSDQIRWGLNYSRQIGKTPPRPDFGARRQGQNGNGGPNGNGGGGLSGVPGGELLSGARGGADQPPPPPPEAGAPSTTGQAPGATTEEAPRPGQGFEGGGRQGGGPGGFSGPGGGFGGPGGPGGGFGGGGFRGGGGPRAARLQLSLYHTIHLRERVLIQDGVPALDLLNGDVLGSGGGQPRNEVEAQAGVTKMGLGARLSANWHSATEVHSGQGGASSDLDFSSLATLNVRLFADLTARRDLIQAHPILRGTRLTLSFTNLFDARQKVHDATGATPVTYQPDYLDPRGRSVQFTFRKLIF